MFNEVKVEHVLILVIAILLIYHVVGSSCANGVADGFSVGIPNFCGDSGTPEGKLKQMGVQITKENSWSECNTTASTCVTNDTLLIDWSNTTAPVCKSNQCGGSDTPKSRYYYNRESNRYIPIGDYNGSWTDTGQNADNLFTLSGLDKSFVCTIIEPDNPSGTGWEELGNCIGGTRALCGYKINNIQDKYGFGGRCEGVTSGIPNYCKKDEYCCDGKCCQKPCGPQYDGCRKILNKLCNAEKSLGKEQCLNCAGKKQQELKVAGCSHNMIDYWCDSSKIPSICRI